MVLKRLWGYWGINMERILKSLFIEYARDCGNLLMFDLEVWRDPIEDFNVRKTCDGYICDFPAVMGKLMLFGRRDHLRLLGKDEECLQAFQSICGSWSERKKIMEVLKEKDCLRSVDKIEIDGDCCAIEMCYAYFHNVAPVFRKLIKLDTSKIHYNKYLDRFEWKIEMNTENFINMIRLIAD